MGRGNENLSGVIRHSNIRAGMKSSSGNSTAQAGHNRRALSTIDSNVIAVQRRAVLTEKHAACQRNSVVPLHRPVTRTYAAQLAVKEKQLSHEGVKPSINQTAAYQSSDCTIIDAENYDHDVPMYVHPSEAMLEEIDRMDAEVEMEDVVTDEEVMDIDTCDKRNPLEVTEYIEDMHTHYKKTEILSCVPSNYMAQQFDMNDRMRAILIDWLIEVHYKFELMDETLYLTVNLIDRFLAVQAVVRKKLQLVGITAMLLACKYEEVSVPVVEDLILISDKAYCRKEILDMEKLMVNTLQFNLSFPTPYVFMRRYLKAAQSDKKLEHLSFFILELCLVEYEVLRFTPSLLAAAAIFTAQCTLSGSIIWNKTCERHTNYTKDQLLVCARLMVTLHQKAGNGKLTGVYKKYNTSKFGYASKIAPAVVIEDAEQ